MSGGGKLGQGVKECRKERKGKGLCGEKSTQEVKVKVVDKVEIPRLG